METRQKVGFVGTGVMGGPMVGHLLEAGYEVSIFTRTKAKAEYLIEKGARWCNSPAEIAANSDE